MKIIYGPKGTGKTKTIIEMANASLETAKGHIIFVTDTSRYSKEIKYQIRFLDVTGFDIQRESGLRGFIKGLVAANGDNEIIFIDGISRITGKELSKLSGIFKAMEKLEADYGVEFVLTCSAKKEDLPKFVLKHV